MTEEMKLAKVLNFYGLDNQEEKLIEEMAELTQALIKLRLDGYTPKLFCHVQEEMEDVRLVLDQLAIRYGRHPLIRAAKLERTMHRIEEMEKE